MYSINKLFLFSEQKEALGIRLPIYKLKSSITKKKFSYLQATWLYFFTIKVHLAVSTIFSININFYVYNFLSSPEWMPQLFILSCDAQPLDKLSML